MTVDPSEVARLSQAFHPATPEGLARKFWELNVEIGRVSRSGDTRTISKLRATRDNLRSLLIDICRTDGIVIEVPGLPPLRLTRELTLHRDGTPQYHHGVTRKKLDVRFDR